MSQPCLPTPKPPRQPQTPKPPAPQQAGPQALRQDSVLEKEKWIIFEFHAFLKPYWKHVRVVGPVQMRSSKPKAHQG